MKQSVLFYFLFAWSLFQLSSQSCVPCSVNQPRATAPHVNVWQSISEEEMTSAVEAVSQRLNLTSELDPVHGYSNTIWSVGLLQPNKSSVLPYIENRGAEPKRYARVTVLFGASEEPYLQEYLVGPLLVSNATAVQPLGFPFNNQHRGRSRVAPIDLPTPTEFVTQLSGEVEDITRELWNTTIAEGGVHPSFGTVLYEADGMQTVWTTFFGLPSTGFDSISLLPLGVYVRLNVTSRRWQDWHTTAWYYRGTFYDSTDSFRTAVFAPDFRKPPPNVDGSWTSTDRQGAPLPFDELPPPVSVSQGTERFSIDSKENYIAWMNFDFFLSTSLDQGLSLFDIRYNGTRIIYELSLQEALAHYAGADPFKSESLFFDTRGGMGYAMVSLVKGYDCPNHATYINVTYASKDGPISKQNAICLFEADANFPMRRHSVEQTTSVSRNVVFTVRWISTVGNYDYLFDYNFFYDGAIEVSIRASGYISAGYFDEHEEYGFHIHDFLSGSLHDHVMTFKVDLDIMGVRNSVQKVEITPTTVTYPWSDGKPRNTMKLARSFLGSEGESSITWPPNDAAIYAIVNRESANKYGESPGYRLKRSASATHLTVQNSSNAGKAIHYATADFFITRQKDTEPRCADSQNYRNIDDPLVDFSKFLDDESLDQEDLVVWLNLGMHHVPHTGDLPNTVMTSAHSAVRLEPLNYLNSDPSIASYQQIWVNATSGEAKRFGAELANCSVDLSSLNGV